MDQNPVTKSLDLTGKVAIITGGSRGIGRSIATGFAQHGASVVITSRDQSSCEKTVKEITKTGGKAIPVAAHIGKLSQVENLVLQTVEAYGTVDIIVNNAANPLMLGVGDITPEAWEKALNTNLRGPVFLVQESLPYLEAGTGGSVINMLSNAAFMYPPNHLLYSVAKAGLDAATRSMAAQLASKNIRVNAMVPGTVDTDMVQAMPESFQKMAAKGSLLRRAAQPDEMVAMALVLASDAGSFMTGHTYFVDGGQSYR
ncbi:MAG: SDR family NAD(P)-dependent oxidoreductase [Acidimicrobiales bacterium]|nr:SDR family NAD(P)-dependent oxidoreductase [Acidimicrobiales bacterium]